MECCPERPPPVSQWPGGGSEGGVQLDIAAARQIALGPGLDMEATALLNDVAHPGEDRRSKTIYV